MRSAEFDRDQVLLSAMDVFITKGYSNTSMQDLKKRQDFILVQFIVHLTINVGCY